MKTYLECIPCFLNQALRVINLSTEGNKVKLELMNEIIKELGNIDLRKNPPAFATFFYNKITEVTGIKDPYKELKKKDNQHALSLVPMVRKIIENSEDKLLTAIKVSIAGNIMDFALQSDYDVKKTIETVINSDFVIDHYDKFKEDLLKAKNIVYLADNAGEVVFDKLLLEKIRESNKSKVYFFCKKKAIINDATLEDVKIAGIDKIDNIEVKKIDGFPNVVNDKSNEEFIKLLKESDLVISKGQANYECLSGVNVNLYFLLIAKCPVIARDLNVKQKDIILKRNSI